MFSVLSSRFSVLGSQFSVVSASFREPRTENREPNDKIRGIMRLIVFLLATIAAIPSSEYQARRARLAKEIGPNAMLVVFSGKPKARDMDIEYPFRQGDWMMYLTGINQPDTTLVML